MSDKEVKIYTIKRIKKQRKLVVIKSTEKQNVSLQQYIGLRLKDIRIENKITQLMLSKHIGCTRTTIANIERGSQMITLNNLEKICYYFGIKSSDILPF